MLSRQAQIFTGGPAEGFLQSFSAPARLVALLVLVMGAALSTSLTALALTFTIVMAAALLSYLPMPSLLKIVALPVILLAAPTWLVGIAFFNMDPPAAAVALVRVATSTSTGVVLAHSIGLSKVPGALAAVGLPAPLAASLQAAVSQAFIFSDLSTEMEMARRARTIRLPKGGLLRRLMGGQMAILLGRMLERSRELTLAAEARTIHGLPVYHNSQHKHGWRAPDAALIGASLIIAAGLVLA